MSDAFADTGAPDNRIAIIGRAGRFPAARNVAEYWQMLHAGRRAATKLTQAELLAAGVSRKMLVDPTYVPEANILPDMECFDAGFFGFSPREASILDPQHRHFLETAWEAFEDAGHMPENFDGRIGVYAGSGMQAYLPFNLLSNPALVEEIGLFLLRHTGNDKDFLPTRLSYLLNLTGPSVAVQTACSTSLVAVHMAVNSLLNMECEMAIAGGVTIELPHRVGYRFAEGEILSPDGLCRAFDDDSQGTVFGSGAALVVLRRYADAIADGDDIKAVILGTAINNDGAGKASYLAPSVDGQAEAAAEAVALAGVTPQSISYIEAHGTGTPIGDPIELAALQQVYGKAAKGSIGIGSVKTNIGHLDTAAGGASLIKVIEAMRHKHLPASLNFKTPNSRFDFAGSPFEVVSKGRDWPAGATPRRAAVNSLGVGGTNAHVIVEEAPARAKTQSADGWRIFPFSARTASALARTGDKWVPFLASDALDPADIAFTLRTGRRAFPERMAVAARSTDDLAAALTAKASAFVQKGKAGATPPSIVFLFPGGGAQYPGAGAGMLAGSPAFAKAVADCFAALPKDAPADLHEMMFARTLEDAEARGKLGRSGYAIPALFILEYAYAKHWQSWGITPDAILAHSVGEYAGAVTAGAMGLSDALRIVTLRGQVMDAAPAGAMTTVPKCAPAVQEMLGEHLDIAAINMAEATVVSGPLAEIEALEARLADTDHAARRIHIDVAAHSRQLDGQLDRFRAGFDGVRFGKLTVPMVSSLRGDWAQGDDIASADYWVRHLRHTVRFTDAIAATFADENRIVIEVGPGQTLGPLVDMASLTHRPLAILPSAPRPRDETDELGVVSAAFGGLWANGVPVDWNLLHGAEGQRVSLPTYAFEKDRHWVEPGRGAVLEDTAEAAPELTRIPDMADWVEVLGWDAVARSGASPDLHGDWLVLAGNDALSAAVLASLERAGASVTVLRAGTGFAAISGGFALRPDATEDFEALAATLPAIPARILSLWALDPALSETVFDAGYLLARMLQQVDAGTNTHLVFAVSGSVSVAGEAVNHPTAASLLGPVRVGPREIPGLTTALIDIAGFADDAQAAEAMLAEAAGATGSDHVALRGADRYIQTRTATAAPLPDTLPARLRQGGVYVITGGVGGIGRQMALWLARTAAARLALISRNALLDTDFEAAIMDAGGEVIFLAADVTDSAAMEKALTAVRSRFGAIHGVIHAAGVLHDAPLSVKSLAEARTSMAPKVGGVQVVHGLLTEGTVDFFAVISSSSVIIGGAGQTDYVAANAVLEAVAASRRDGISIAWGVWRDTGMAARLYGAGDGVATAGADGLLGTRHENADGTTRFETVIDPDNDWRVAEHVVAGQPVLPGTAYVEMAYAAAVAVLGQAPFEIHALSLAVPMVFDTGLPRRVLVHLSPVHNGFELNIESISGPTDEPLEHARAQIKIFRYEDRQLPQGVADAVALAPAPRSGHAPQEVLIAFGPRWKNVGAVQINDDIAEGVFSLAPDFAGDLADHPLHPALLDMAATVGLHCLADGGAGDAVYVPMSADRVRVLHPLPMSVVARARRVAGEEGKFAAFDVVISTLDGIDLMVLEHLALRAVAGGALQTEPNRAGLTDQLLAVGIRATEAADLLTRVFAHPARALVVSPVSLDLVRLAMTQGTRPTPAAQKRQGGSGGAITDPISARVAAIWGEILGIDAVGADDDFFALGGHSLNAVRMFGRIRKEFGHNLPLATLFEAPRVRDLAATLKDRGVSIAAAAAEVATPAAALPPVVPPTTTSPLILTLPRQIEMTEAQREIATAILINPDSSLSYNLSFSLHIKGKPDPKALQAALDGMIARHDSLRAGFDVEQFTLTIRPAAELPLQQVDLTGLSAAEQSAKRDGLHKTFAEQAFDLIQGPLIRAVLVQLSANRHELMLFVHHIACDGWSMGIVMRDLAALYSEAVGGPTAMLDPPGSIADLLAAEIAWARSPQAAAHRDYWLQTFADGIPAMDMPTDRPHPQVMTTTADRVTSTLDPTLERGLRGRAAEAQTSLRTLIFGAFQLYLSRLTGARDVVVGLPSSGQLSHGLEGVVGHGVNFLPIRARIDTNISLANFLAQTRRCMLDAMDHQNYTYGALMRDMNVARDASRVSIVPVVVNIDNLAEMPDFQGLKTELVANSTGHEHFELFFNLLDAQGRVTFSWNYNTDLFYTETVEQHAENFLRLLRAIVTSGDGLNATLGKFLVGDTHRPASGTHEDPGAAGPQTITEVFATVAAQMPDRVALRFGSQTMDYATLNARSDALAAHLATEGIGAGDLVGISSQRSLALMVAVLGVLKAGAGYVPFDTALPAERLGFMAQDTGIKVLLGSCPAVTAAGVKTLPYDAFPTKPAAAPNPKITGTSIAYVMFTSGTTGTPKGVVLPHRSVIRMLCDTDWLRLGPDTVTLHSSAFAFDTSIIDIFAALLHGGAVVIPKDGALSIADLADAVASNGVNTLWLTSGLFHAVADSRPAAFAKVDQVIVGGDIVSPGHVARVKAACPDVAVINGYGPTESNVTNAHLIEAADLASGQALPIGRAVPGTQIYILDENLQPVPTGVMGELCIAGRGLALGYWNRPDLTSEKFIAVPWQPGLRLYRSGDLALDPGNGVIRFFGRIDSQVKIRGFRVELSEVEAAIESHPGVQQAVVLALVPEGQTDKILVAYFVQNDSVGRPVTPAALADHVRLRLPDFARPTFFVAMDEIPLNPNGKVDRRRLTPVSAAAPDPEGDLPQGENEQRLAKIWGDILGHRKIGATSNFFALGGHSLLAVRLFDRIRKEFGVDLPISTLFRHQTLRDLANLIPDQGKAEVKPLSDVLNPDDAWDTSTIIHPGPGAGRRRTLFIVGGVGGNVNNLVELGSLLGRTRAVIGFQTRGVLGHHPRGSIIEMAQENIGYLRQHQPTGPYLLAGYSGGALTALEMARQLEAAGEAVARLFILDTFAPGFAVDFVPKVRTTWRRRLHHEVGLLRNEGLGYLWQRISIKVTRSVLQGPVLVAMRHISLSHYRYQIMETAWHIAARGYQGGPLHGPITLFLSRPVRLMQKLSLEADPSLGWAGVADDGQLELIPITGDHLSMLKGEHVQNLALLIDARADD
jgi:amino acid adenylation domain-containing protein